MTRPDTKAARARADAATVAPGYEVTPDGRVFSTESNWRGRGRFELVPVPNSHGYLRVHLSLGGRRVSRFVHKLVASVFLEPRPSPRHELRHLDGDKTNNAAANLAWGTRAENAADRERHGRTARGERNGAAVLTADAVKRIRAHAAAGLSQRQIAAVVGASQRAVGRVLRGETWGDA